MASMFENLFGGSLGSMQQQQSGYSNGISTFPSRDEYLRMISSRADPAEMQVSGPNPDTQFDQLKKSVKQIEAEPFESGARKRIESKIGRLQKAGATAQAIILESELTTRDTLTRLKEWDYKLLTKKTIEQFKSDNTMTMTRDGLKVHIDPIEKYCGNPQVGEAKDRIIPDHILDSLGTAKERELFDEYVILWAEKVKDPLLLGIVDGCEDYFFIAEWGEDITFEQISKGKFDRTD